MSSNIIDEVGNGINSDDDVAYSNDDDAERYADISYLRGWDARAGILGNPHAPYRSPVPGAMRDYQRGWDAADETTAHIAGKGVV